jgi:cell wall-associated NlpC family hydrolase
VGGGGQSGSAFGAAVAAAALRYRGTPYSWGGGGLAGPTYGVGEGAGIMGFDCSGLVRYAVYEASAGRVVLPHSSEEQATLGRPVEPDRIQVGDVIAFQLSPGDYDHIGIYIGQGEFVQAPKTGDVVKVSNLSDPYYAGKPIAVRRFG